MVSYTFRKFCQSILLIGVVLLINFFILRLTPGNPYDTAQYSILSDNHGTPFSASQQSALDTLRNRLSIYYDPWPKAFTQWTLGVLHMDFGNSIATGQPFTPQLLTAALNSFWLLFFASLIGLIFGVGLGVYTAYRPNTWQDNVIKLFALVVIALPGWYMLIAFDWVNDQIWLLSGKNFSIIPKAETLEQYRNLEPNVMQFWFNFKPIFFLGAILLALFWGQTRSEVLGVLSQDYVRTAKAKGLSSSRVLGWHVVRNSLIPIISIFKGLLPFVLASQILIEKYSGWNGLSRVFLEAASSRDYTILMGVFTLLVFVCVGCNFLAEIGYALIDPKIRDKNHSGIWLAKPSAVEHLETNLQLKKTKLRLVIAGGLAALFIFTVGFIQISSQAITKKTDITTTFEAFSLPADTKVLETDITIIERKSFLAPRVSSSITYSPQPDQDKQKESKRTVFSTKMSGLDITKSFRQQLEGKGWTASSSFNNQANSVRVDYVFEKGNQYFWLSASSILGIAYELRTGTDTLSRKLESEINQGTTIVVIVQGFKSKG